MSPLPRTVSSHRFPPWSSTGTWRTLAATTMIDNAISQAIDQYDWGSLRTSTGDACDIPNRLCKLVYSTTEDEARKWYDLLEDYIVVQGGVYDAALPSLNVLIVALMHYKPTVIATTYIFDLVFQVVDGTADLDTIRNGRGAVVDECIQVVKDNLSLLQSRSCAESELTLNLINQSLYK